METVVLIVALWLILVGIYGALSLLSGPPRSASGRPQRRPKAARQQAPQQFTQPYNYDYDLERDASGAILSEVDLLRAQVRHLRSEIFAMSDKPREDLSSKPKRYRGQTDLPRPLRRHLRETRGVRTA